MQESDDHPRTVAIIQARMGSSRLPGKVLKDIAGEPMLAREISRVRRAVTLDEVVVATTTEAEDDPVAELCRARGYPFYRGSLFDVLDRYYQAALQFSAQVVVRLTADCPLIDPAAIDQTVRAFFAAGVDFAANRLPEGRTVPIGFDTEVCTFAVLERAWREASQPYEREHVMPYLYNTPGRFRTLLVKSEPDHGRLRWTVDTAEDLELVRAVYARFPGRDDFSYQEMLDLFAREPHLAQINAGVRHKGFQDVDARHSA